MPLRTRFSTVSLAVAGSLWLAALAAGLSKMSRYESTAGVSGEAPPVWPAACHLSRDPARPTLVVVAHPKCLCFAATLESLAQLLARSPGSATVHVLFFKPAEAGEDWAQTAAWRKACAIPGVIVSTDDASNQAHSFGCATAGDAVFYDAAGRLRFHGGLTASRGEPGECAGTEALQALLGGASADFVQTPVFGCSLSRANRTPAK